jgi:hypothetical protein
MRLLRLGDFISPNAIIEHCGTLTKCEACDRGLVGNAIDRTLSYCSCMWGVELEHANPGWPECEIERVHSNEQSLMAAACRELAMPFTADGIEAGGVNETADTVTIHPAAGDNITFQYRDLGKDLDRIRQRLGWTRRIVVAGAENAYTCTQTGSPRPITAADFAPYQCRAVCA